MSPQGPPEGELDDDDDDEAEAVDAAEDEEDEEDAADDDAPPDDDELDVEAAGSSQRMPSVSVTHTSKSSAQSYTATPSCVHDWDCVPLMHWPPWGMSAHEGAWQ